MARDFFDKPASGFTPISGTIISDVQLALNAATNGNIDTDGLYGGHTGDALAAYQAANHLTASGNVTDETWSALMRTDAPPIFERCLQVTASFEGTGFTLVVGNFDGAGITWGIIGFTLLGGELGTVLKTVNDTDPHLITQAFGRDADQIMEITGADTSAAKKTQWADSISRGSSKYNVAEPWKTYFSDLGKFREVQRVQVARARDIYWAIAKDNASQLGLGEELDYLLMYDIAVQNGGMGSKGRLQKAQAAIHDQRPRTAQAKRKIIASVVADTITSRYKQDVLDRKTSIAVGKGIVHGGKYDLSGWGLLDGESPASV
jgi:hypothetical protein